LPIPLILLLPADSGLVLSSGWFSIMVLETLLFAIGTAFIILVMAKERSDLVHRAAASTDELTGIANRRGFMEEADRLIRKQAWKNQPVSVLMFDLDHFKSINDRFGHAVGDEALRVFARTATVSLRASDAIGRLGGEEFAAILPSDLPVALVAAERVRAAFAAAAAEVSGENVAATVSIGVASAAEMPCDLAAVLARADAALYRAKKAGRNRVEADAGLDTSEGAPVAPESDRRRDDIARPKNWVPAAQNTSAPAPVALRVVDGKWLRAAS
jgi:diguanylate cyclase (GGDEF)-like protein